MNHKAQTTIDLAVAIGILVAGIAVALTVVGPFFSGTNIDQADTEVQAQAVANYVLIEKLEAKDGNGLNKNEISPDRFSEFFPQPTDEVDESLSENTDIPLKEGVEARVSVETDDETFRESYPPTFNTVFQPEDGVVLYGSSPTSTAITSEYTVYATLDGMLITITVETWNEATTS